MYNKENRSGHRAISGFRISPCSMAVFQEYFIMDKIKKNFGFWLYAFFYEGWRS